ncbi:MAG: hypothetical protein DRQ55_03840 [Planctomycetota bacterium]|nr:MAG: hypothetical protein DRQ55_03840 [Planctomycetota bacterium]
MFPLFFGKPDRQLYGVYHMPELGRALPLGAVLCQPILHEYADARRAFRALADRLAKAGVHALRFDYQGTGDSAGNGDTCAVDRWLEDIETAIDELKASRGLEAVGLVGLRFGATLAAQVASRRDDVPFSVLWEPVTAGATYLDQLRKLQTAWVNWECRTRPSARSQASQVEVFGHPLSEQLAAGLARTDLPPLSGLRSARSLFVDEGSAQGGESLRREAALRDTQVQACHIDGGQVWRREFDGAQAQVPFELLSQVTNWIREGAETP